MVYNVSSKDFSNPLLKTLLVKLTDFFNSKGLKFYVIGAAARDIMMRQILTCKPTRMTTDLDIAISSPDRGVYDEISEGLMSIGFEKSRMETQKFYFGDYELDIVPFGEVAKDKDNIYWPPDETFMMSVKGFNEILDDMVRVNVDEEFDIYITSLKGLFLLKWYAWLDRNNTKTKDAEDMCLILQEYFNIHAKEYAVKGYHDEVFEEEDFDIFSAGATWLAYDLLLLLDKKRANELAEELTRVLASAEESRLFEHMTIQNRSLKYEIFQKAITSMRDVFTAYAKEETK